VHCFGCYSICNEAWARLSEPTKPRENVDSLISCWAKQPRENSGNFRVSPPFFCTYRMEELTQKSAKLFHQGKFVEAKEVLNQLKQQRPSDFKVLHNIALCELSLEPSGTGPVAGAEKLLSKLLQFRKSANSDNEDDDNTGNSMHSSPFLLLSASKTSL
jgi:hypothetical protein